MSEDKRIVIEEGESFLRVYLNGNLLYNYHDEGYRHMKSCIYNGDLLYWLLLGDTTLFNFLVQQLREEGYFKTDKSEVQMNQS